MDTNFKISTETPCVKICNIFCEMLRFYGLIKLDKRHFEVKRINLRRKYFISFGPEELVYLERPVLASRPY
jgi:hypothetical protein